MAVIKCKMCGGDLVIEPGSTVAECEFCGSKQTVPVADDEKKMLQFERAERLRKNCEFDKAAGLYEAIIADFHTEAEAYWGLVLCKYGIEYVDDPASGKKIPTCHRSSFDSVMEDTDFEQALENADVLARRVYRDEAKQIEELRKGIIEVSGKEEPYDIFICYKETAENGDRTIDSVIAQDVYDALTEKGYRVFFSRISLEDKLGQEYEPYIFAALNSAKIMLAFGTDYEYYNAVWVKNEWSRYLKLMAKDKSKHLIPCYKNIDAYDMPKEFAKLQAQDMGKVGAMQDLLRGIEKILPRVEEKAINGMIAVQQMASVAVCNAAEMLKRGFMSLEDGAFEEAQMIFNEMLNSNAESADAYLGLFMADIKANNQVEAREAFISGNLAENRYWKRAKEFASDDLQVMLSQWDNKRKEYNKAYTPTVENQNSFYQDLISSGGSHTAGLKSDGTVVAVGYNEYGQCNVSDWEDIIAVSAGDFHTVGLKSDGTVVAAGWNSNGQCNVQNWKNIVKISAGGFHTVGLKSDGTVVAVGQNDNGECNVYDWEEIVSISAGGGYTVGLKSDGTVVSVGINENGERSVTKWKDIAAISAAGIFTAGLKNNGAVITVGENKRGCCNVTKWKDIIAISANGWHTVGLKSDGTVVAVGDKDGGECDVTSWRDIIAISAGSVNSVGLKADGTVVAVGCNEFGECNVSGWKLCDSSIDSREALLHNINTKRVELFVEDIENRKSYLEQIEKEIKSCKKNLERAKSMVTDTQVRIDALETSLFENNSNQSELYQQKAVLEAELASIHGFFTGKKKAELQAKIDVVDRKIREIGALIEDEQKKLDHYKTQRKTEKNFAVSKAQSALAGTKAKLVNAQKELYEKQKELEELRKKLAQEVSK